MKVNAVITKPKIIGKGSHLSPSKISLLISCFAIFFGIIFGSLIYILNPNFISEGIMKYFISFSTEFSGKTFIEIFSGNFSANMPYYFLCVIFGTCALGAVPVTAATFVKSLGIGVLSAYIFGVYELRGLEYYLLTIFPGKIIFMMAMIILSQICVTSSQQIKKAIKNQNSEFDKNIYYKRCLVIFALLTVSALVDSVMVKCFSSLFNFS